MVGITMQKVEAPPPSRCPTRAMTAVTTATPTTLSPTVFHQLADDHIEHSRIGHYAEIQNGKTNKAAVGPVLEKPDLIMVARLSKE